MPKSTITAREKAEGALAAANSRVDRKADQHAKAKALAERLEQELADAVQVRDYAAKHPALDGRRDNDESALDQGDVVDDGSDDDPFA